MIRHHLAPSPRCRDERRLRGVVRGGFRSGRGNGWSLDGVQRHRRGDAFERLYGRGLLIDCLAQRQQELVGQRGVVAHRPRADGPRLKECEDGRYKRPAQHESRDARTVSSEVEVVRSKAAKQHAEQ